ncbi:hypothetical protein D3C72_804260 [compost metagenome]
MTKRWLPLLTALAILVAPVPAAFADGHPGKTDVFAGEEAFSHAAAEGVRYDPRLGGFRLRDEADSGYRRSGYFLIDHLRYSAGFDTAVASWNADCPVGTWVKAELSASHDDGKTWSAWYEMASWGDPSVIKRQPKTGKVKADEVGRVNEDTLQLKRPATRLRYRLWLQTERPDATPLVTLAAVSVVDAAKTLPPDDTPGRAWGKEVPAQFRSQSQLPSDISWRGCGPTSLTMALTAHGIALPTESVAHACWDELNGLYGNWPFLAAAGSQLMRQAGETIKVSAGRKKVFRSYVSWAPDWKEVEDEVLAGRPVLVSIYFGEGELKGSMTEASDGHLILVRGFTKDGHPICLDPAARNEAKGRVIYDRRELHRARHGGPIIVFRPVE